MENSLSEASAAAEGAAANLRERRVVILALVLFAALLGLVFNAYLSPDMMFEFANLLLCT